MYGEGGSSAFPLPLILIDVTMCVSASYSHSTYKTDTHAHSIAASLYTLEKGGKTHTSVCVCGRERRGGESVASPLPAHTIPCTRWPGRLPFGLETPPLPFHIVLSYGPVV